MKSFLSVLQETVEVHQNLTVDKPLADDNMHGDRIDLISDIKKQEGKVKAHKDAIQEPTGIDWEQHLPKDEDLHPDNIDMQNPSVRSSFSDMRGDLRNAQHAIETAHKQYHQTMVIHHTAKLDEMKGQLKGMESTHRFEGKDHY